MILPFRTFRDLGNSFFKLLFRDPRSSETWSSMVCLAWALWQLRSSKPLEDLPTMRFITDLLTGHQWIALAFVLGISQLWALLLEAPFLRYTLALVAAYGWSLIVIGIFLAEPDAHSIPVYAGFAGINAASAVLLIPRLREAIRFRAV